MSYLIAGLMAWTALAAPAKKVYLGAESKVDWTAAGKSSANGPAQIANPAQAVIALTDSANNEYAYWTTIQDPIDVWGQGLAWLYRHWTPDGQTEPTATGYLKIQWTHDGGTTWEGIDSLNYKVGLYNGGGRYPTAVYMNPNPVATWPELDTLAGSPYDWGFACAATADPANPRGIATSNLGVHKHTGVKLNSGYVFTFATDASQIIYLGVYDPVNGTWAHDPEPKLADLSISGMDYDYINDVVYIFGFDASDVFCYYTATWDGSNISVSPNFTPFAGVPQIDLGGGYVLDGIINEDARLSFDGQTNPVTVKPVGVASLAAYQSQGDTLAKAVVYVDEDTSYPIIVLTTDPNDFLYYPQITTDGWGNYVVMWEQMTQADANVGWGWYDIMLSMCTDHIGETWSTPENLTQTDTTVNECLLQVPRHFYNPDGNPRIWFSYAYDPYGHKDLYKEPWDGSETTDPTYLDLCYTDQTIAVAETPGARANFSYRMVGHDLLLNLPANLKARVEVYDVAGREVKSTEGTGSLRVNLGNLSTGTYLFRVTTGASAFVGTGKVVIAD